MPNQLERTAAYVFPYPMVRKQKMKILLSEHIQAVPESYTINSDFFYYDFSSNYDKSSNILTLDYYYKNQADHVPTSGFDRFYNEMLQLDKNAGYLIMTNNSKQALSTNFQSKLLRFLGVILIAAILIGLILAAIVLIQHKVKT